MSHTPAQVIIDLKEYEELKAKAEQPKTEISRDELSRTINDIILRSHHVTLDHEPRFKVDDIKVRVELTHFPDKYYFLLTKEITS